MTDLSPAAQALAWAYDNEGRWYWVRLRNTHPDPLDDLYQDPCDGWDVAKHDPKAAGGWRDGDTWEDFDKQVYCLAPDSTT